MWNNLTAEIESMFSGLSVFEKHSFDGIEKDNDLARDLTRAYKTKGPRGHNAREAALRGVESRRADPLRMRHWLALQRRPRKRGILRPGRKVDRSKDDIIAALIATGKPYKAIRRVLGSAKCTVLRVAAERGLTLRVCKSGGQKKEAGL